MRVSEMAREYVPQSDEKYFPLPARRRSECRYCTVSIEKGDAIVRRPGDTLWAHLRCAEAEDERREDLDGVIERELALSRRWREQG